MEIFIVFSSPAGTTKKAACIIEKELIARGHSVAAYDLGSPSDAATVHTKIIAAPGDFCLIIGSPVYACHAVPPVTEFLAGLSETKRGYAVPYVTCGCVNSGLTLHEMGSMLAEKGYRIPGAAALPAEHSMLWQSGHPLGQGRPDKADEAVLQKFIAAVSEKITSGTGAMLDRTALNYQPGPVRETMQKLSLASVRNVLPAKAVDKKLCTKCGTCATLCPAGAITLSPYPVFGPSCFFCYSCVRLCPENALVADFSLMENNLQQRSSAFNEKSTPRLFF
ncbi:MAG: EFR1 family ferrodoxin [Pseudomonadota bacterium]